MEDRPSDPASWSVPSPYGRTSAIQGVGSAAAVLAGFALTLGGVVMSSPDRVRWPDLALLLIVVAAVALIGCVQCAFRARDYAATRRDILDWWDDPGPERLAELRIEQHRHRRRFTKWANLTRHAYNIGIAAFLAGFAAAIVPPDDVSGFRVVVVIIAVVAAAGELVWIGEDHLTRRRRASQ